MGITRFKIRRTKIVLVGKYRYSKKEKEDHLSKFTTWNSWKIGLWFRRNKIMGVKNFKDPRKWGQNLVNDYMLGFDFLIVTGWINWNTSGMSLKIDELEKQKNMTVTDVMIYEKVATNLIDAGKVQKGMSEEDMIIEIYNETTKSQGATKSRYLMKVDKDYVSDTISEINERLKNKVNG